MPSTGWPSISDPPAAATLPARAHWLGRVGYGEACALQHALVGARQRGEVPDTFLFLEHPPVITLGRAAHAENLVAPPALLAARGVELWETTRGGDVTYHGPGQLVGYGIVDLKDHGRDVAAYLRRLEQALIALLAGHGLAGERRPGYTGVWLGREKVCAMGVRVDRWVTSHGFALNVAAELSNFDLIVPCGIRGYGVTSVERATGRPHDLEQVAAGAATALAAAFGWRMERGGAGDLDLPAAAGDRILGGVRRLVPEAGE
jgi:lipoyl(octanoyl) transferase